MPLKLVSMKMTAAEQSAKMEPSLAKEDRPRYPWGLTLNLDTDSLEKLGIDDLPAPGEKYMLVAEVAVESVSKNAGTSGTNKSMSLQITKMCLEDGDDKKDTAKTLYEGDK